MNRDFQNRNIGNMRQQNFQTRGMRGGGGGISFLIFDKFTNINKIDP